MNIKKLGLPVLCCGAAFLTSCGYEFIQHKDLNYEDAKAWVKAKYGEGTDEGTIKTPKSVTSEWFIDGKVFGTATGEADIPVNTGYLKNHFINFLAKSTNLDSKEISPTEIKDRDVNKGEFGFKTSKVFTSDPISPFYYSLDGKHMNETLDYFFKGSRKYGALYRTYTDKKLDVYGNFYYALYNKDNIGYDMLDLPNCTLSFNSDGSLSKFKFEFSSDVEGDYYWVSAQKASYSGATYFNMLKGSYISINFNY